jgi:hypothetical protein
LTHSEDPVPVLYDPERLVAMVADALQRSPGTPDDWIVVDSPSEDLVLDSIQGAVDIRGSIPVLEVGGRKVLVLGDFGVRQLSETLARLGRDDVVVRPGPIRRGYDMRKVEALVGLTAGVAVVGPADDPMQRRLEELGRVLPLPPTEEDLVLPGYPSRPGSHRVDRYERKIPATDEDRRRLAQAEERRRRRHEKRAVRTASGTDRG